MGSDSRGRRASIKPAMRPLTTMLTAVGILLCLAVTTHAIPPPSRSAKVPYSRILNFGDSWAWLGEGELKKTLGKFGVSTTTHAIPGAPVSLFALTPKTLLNQVTKSNATAVILSVGGNDFLEQEPKPSADKDRILAEMLRNTDKILMPLFTERPDVHVYQFGYELMDWSSSVHCKGYGNALLRRQMCPLGWIDVECCNKAQQSYLQQKYVDALAAKYKAKGYHYHGLNLLGTLQAAGGVPGAAVGAPNLKFYSPEKYVLKDSTPLGCVHLTPLGYNTLYAELVKKMGYA